MAVHTYLHCSDAPSPQASMPRLAHHSSILFALPSVSCSYVFLSRERYREGRPASLAPTSNSQLIIQQMCVYRHAHHSYQIFGDKTSHEWMRERSGLSSFASLRILAWGQ